jgi:Cache domain
MAKHHYYLDTRVLTAFFFAAMPFVAFGSFIVVNMARTQLRESVGVGLEQRAVQTKLALEGHVGEHLVDLRLIAAEPDVQNALASAPRAASAEEAQRLEKAWASGSDARLGAAVLNSPLATRLRTMAQLRPGLRSLQVVDANGRVLAASTRGDSLFQGESAWFQALLGQEGGAQAWVSDMERPSGYSYAFVELAFPIRAPDGTLQGAVRGRLDASDLYGVLAPVRVGRTGHATLIRATDGMILASDESERVLTTVFPGYSSLSEALQGFPIAAEGEALFGKSRVRRGYWTVQEVRQEVDGRTAVIEPARVVGYSPIDQIPNVKWLVTVEQDLDEALAPITTVTRYLWIHFIGVFTTVILLALYFSFKLEKPIMDEGLHIHEEHIPSSLKARAEADTEA